jgi:hypothetical protein
VLSPGPAFASRLTSTPAQIWSIAESGDGTLWAGTGGDGRLLRLRGSQPEETAFDADEPNIFAVATSGNRTYAAFYEKVDTGSLILKSFLTPAEYQQEWNDNSAAGRQLAYLIGYNHSDGPRLSAIFQQKVSGTGGTAGRHGMTAADMQANYDQNLGAGMLTRVICGYEQNGQAIYGAAWRKAPAGALARRARPRPPRAGRPCAA